MNIVKTPWFIYIDEEIEKLRKEQLRYRWNYYRDEPKSDNYLKLVKQFKRFEGTWGKIPPKQDIKGSFFPSSNNVYCIKEDIRDFIVQEESIRGQYMRQTEIYEKPAYEVAIEEFYNLSNKKGENNATSTKV